MSSATINIIANINFVISNIFFFFSVAQLINKNKPLSNYFLSVIYFSVGIQCLSFWLYFRSSPIFEKFFYYSDTAFIFLIGSFLYLFFLYITSDTPITSRTILLHSVPFFAALVLIEGINLYYPSLADKKWLPVFDLFFSASYLSLFIYLILIFRLLLNFYKKNKTSEIKTLIFIIVCSLFFSFLFLFSNTLWQDLQFISQVAFILIPVSFIFFLIRYPHYFNKAQKESQGIRYRNSKLSSIDKEKVIDELDVLIEQEKIYIDGSLTLKTLSTKLNITSAQLSELLNIHYKSNFNNFINSYRIEEAKSILNGKSDINVLQVAFDCGFNSKTTFNTSFRKITGLSPSQYKNQLSSK